MLLKNIAIISFLILFCTNFAWGKEFTYGIFNSSSYILQLDSSQSRGDLAKNASRTLKLNVVATFKGTGKIYYYFRCKKTSHHCRQGYDYISLEHEKNPEIFIYMYSDPSVNIWSQNVDNEICGFPENSDDYDCYQIFNVTEK